MRNTPCLTFAFAAALCAANPAHAASASDALAAFHAALAAGDKARALELMAPDVVIFESGYVERSRDAYADHHLGEDMAFARTATRKVLKQTERLDGNTALIWEETETRGSAHGKPVHAFGTETAILEKKGGTWRLVHVHWSSRKVK